MQHPVIVLKFGGSVLRGEDDLSQGVHEIYRWRREGYRVVAVVSAFEGTTDALLAKANAIAPAGSPDTRALLLATGELSAAALLTLALSRAGISATVFNPHRLALRTKGAGVDTDPASINLAELSRALDECGVAVVPGFVGVGPDQELTLLGRGGSDLTALYIASQVGGRCRLIKDVDGLYERDPALPGPAPRRFRTLDWDRALELDGGIVQLKAVRLAQAHALSFEVGAFQRDDVSVVMHGPVRWYEPDAIPRKPLRIAVLGLGTVGAGVVAHLSADPRRFVVSGILVKDPSRPRDGLSHGSLPITTHPDVAVVGADVIVELIGGIEPARTIIEKALRRSAHVVTANKTLLAAHGEELAKISTDSGATLRYSAAVGGGVPMIEAVARRAPNIASIEGVVNGTTNFILELVSRGIGFNDAVAEAQRRGYAEQDPARDLSGADALDKIIVLARHAFPNDGEIRAVRQLGINADAIAALNNPPNATAIRLVAWARRSTNAIEVGVEPRRVSADHPLAALPDATNRLVIQTTSGSTDVVSGVGAGRWPTAQSVLADLHDLHRLAAAPSRTHSWSSAGAKEVAHGS